VMAQVTPAAPYTPPDDTPVIRVGATIFADYTYTQLPEIRDADGNLVSTSAFNVARGYINITGNVSHIVAFRVTPDITRETGVGPSVSGSLVYRMKYAYAQFNLDDWMWRGSWTRLGIQQTPYVDYAEGIYRYRFQGTIFPEREGFLSSADAGASFHTNFPKNYGDVHVGVYNGENYVRPELNNQNSFQVRGTVRPLPMASTLRGLRVTLFYDADNYQKGDPRDRFIGAVTFEHKYVNAGYEYLNTNDRTLVINPKVKADGYSIWFTPKTTKGFEGLFRFDSIEPNNDVSGRKKRGIGGIAYWFPHQGTVSTALLLDYEQVTFKDFAVNAPRQQRIALHMLVNF
jgi:hypothetical protein